MYAVREKLCLIEMDHYLLPAPQQASPAPSTTLIQNFLIFWIVAGACSVWSNSNRIVGCVKHNAWFSWYSLVLKSISN